MQHVDALGEQHAEREVAVRLQSGSVEDGEHVDPDHTMACGSPIHGDLSRCSVEEGGQHVDDRAVRHRRGAPEPRIVAAGAGCRDLRDEAREMASPCATADAAPAVRERMERDTIAGSDRGDSDRTGGLARRIQ